MHYLHTFITLRHAVKSIIISFYEVIFEHDIAGFVSLRWFYKGYTKEILLKKYPDLNFRKYETYLITKKLNSKKETSSFYFPFADIKIYISFLSLFKLATDKFLITALR